MNPAKKRRMGRPIKPPRAGEHVGLSFRITPTLKRHLVKAAEANGRTQSQEAELRLERSFQEESLERVIKDNLDKVVANINKNTDNMTALAEAIKLLMNRLKEPTPK